MYNGLHVHYTSNYISERKIEYVDFVYEFYVMSYKLELKNSMNGINDNNQNIESVNKYGGFYIGRFEAGDQNYVGDSERIYRQENIDRELEVKKGIMAYMEVTFDEALVEANSMYSDNEAVISQVISGAGWDRTMNWLIETGAKSKYEVYLDSSTWGNYNNSVGNAAIDSGWNNYDAITGKSEYWKINNIYDLAGNCEEMTQEATTEKMITRGGSVSGYCNGYYPAGMRFSEWDREKRDEEISFRVQLFINV